MNIAHIAFYANKVLEEIKSVSISPLTVGFWRGLYEGRGDISLIPDYLIDTENTDDTNL